MSLAALAACARIKNVHTSAARSSPRRCVSTNTASAKHSASARRENEETCRVQTSPRWLRMTSPITSILTRAPLAPYQVHKGSIYTHRLLVCSLRRSTSASSRASAASPVCTVARRAVALLTWIPTGSCSSSRACAYRHPASPPHQHFLSTRRQTSTHEPQLLIQGEKSPPHTVGRCHTCASV